MMKFNTLKEAAQFRIRENEDDYWIKDYWKAAIEIFTKNCNETIKFFQNECTDEEFYWLSEIFEKIAEITQSKELVSALHSRLLKVTPENYNQQAFASEHMKKMVDYNEYVREISEEIEFAEGKIESA